MATRAVVDSLRQSDSGASLLLHAGLVVLAIFTVVYAATVSAQDMPANGVPVIEKHEIKGTSSSWDLESMKKNDNNFWVVTCKQTLGWGKIEYQVDFASAEYLSEIRFDVDLVGWDGPQNYEVFLQYDDGTWSLVKFVEAGAQSLTDNILSGMSQKKVRRLKFQEGQWGWFQMKIDYIYGVKK